MAERIANPAAIEELEQDVSSLNSKIGTIKSARVITATTLELLKTNLINAVNDTLTHESLCIEIAPAFTDDVFNSGQTYSGYAYNIYRNTSLQNVSFFSASLVSNAGVTIDIGYSNGTWYFNNINSKIAPYNLGSLTSLSAIESALLTFSNSLSTQEVRVAYGEVGGSYGLFAQTGYNFTVRKLDVNRCDVMAYRGNNITVIIGNCLNGTWTWDELALNSKITPVTIEDVSFTYYTNGRFIGSPSNNGIVIQVLDRNYLALLTDNNQCYLYSRPSDDEAQLSAFTQVTSGTYTLKCAVLR